MTKNKNAVALGRLGGKAGDRKKKGKGLKAYWASLTPEQKSAEQRRRRAKAKK